ncbi:MAG: acyltransferase [Burkholderiales bacterium]|nr:acyltransferase [Burkholderiales bacterium]
MALWPYRLEAAAARLRAQIWRLRGLAVGSSAAVHAGVRLRFGAPSVPSALGERSVLYRDVQILATGAGSFRIGRDSHLAPGAYVLVGGQALEIGDDVAIGPGLMLFCESNDAGPDGLFRTQYRRAPVRIGNNVFIGARVTVLPGAVIEDGVVVAAHAVVSGRLAAGWVYGGCPARPLRPQRAEASAP